MTRELHELLEFRFRYREAADCSSPAKNAEFQRFWRVAGDPYENRTRAFAVRGRRPNR